MKRNGAHIICELLKRQGIHTVAGIPGGANLPLYDALRESGIRHILVRHEQGGGFLAQGMARATGRAAVCMATSGPGAMNLLTAIADARLDSIPLVAITGQVPTSMIGTDAFQEVDTYGLTLPITKHNFLIRQPEELLEVIPLAFEIAESGRPGPVVVDVPKDALTREAEFDNWPAPWSPAPPAPCRPEDLAPLAEMIARAERPVLYIGGGVIASGASQEVLELARRIAAPAACSLMGLGAIPADDPACLGLLGMHGSRATNFIIAEADLLIAVGARFGDRTTGKMAGFCPNAAIAHIDIDPAEANKLRRTDFHLSADSGQALRTLLAIMPETERPEWTARVRDIQAEHPAEEPPADEPRHPLAVLKTLGDALDPETIITTDVGQHQMWTAQAYPFRRPRTFLTSAGLGTMGFGLPTAIGAALAMPDRKVVCVSGDGSILMNIQELATLAETQADVTVILMNNGHLGLVRQQQELFYGGRHIAVRFEARPDYCAIAKAFGVRALDLADSEDPMDDLRRCLKERGPLFVNIPTPETENVFPMVPPGAANSEMIGGKSHVMR